MPEDDTERGAINHDAALDDRDASLAQRVKIGDSQAFEELARRYLRPIHAVAASYLSEQADIEDAAQETFLRALDRIHTFDPKRLFAPWLYQIARNVARNRRKALGTRRTEPWPERDLPSVEQDAAQSLEQAEIRRLVDRAIERLPEQRRTAFRLFDVEGYTAQEIARLMGIDAGTVRSHVHHARRALRAELAPLLGREETP
ncbi:MAG: RNA polymerase sigma factor [Gemmatimonadales bacterium]